MKIWQNDEGFSGCPTAYFGDIAVVICPPDLGDGSWGIQAFDTADDEALAYGETALEITGFKTEEAARKFAEGADWASV